MRHFQGFAIIEKIHQSVRNQVFRAKRVKDGFPVVLKIPIGPVVSRERVDQAKREFEILKGLNSNQVRRILELNNQKGKIISIYEDFPGTSLRGWRRSKKRSLEDVLGMGCLFAAALETIHEAGVLHQALNPGHILIGFPGDQVRLIDFGLSVRLDLDHAFASGETLFKIDPAYVAPEQTGKTGYRLDQRCDLYALGVILYEMLAGRPPFEAADPWEWAHCHLVRTPAPLVQQAPEIPPQISAIVDKLLVKDPEARYSTARSLGVDLKEALDRLTHQGVIDVFPLQTRFASDRFRISSRPWGREKEIKALVGAFEKVRLGGRGLTLVAGAPGIGKTFLVNTVSYQVFEAGGRFASGKFSQGPGTVPYSGLKAALNQLIAQVFCADDDHLREVMDRIQMALGDLGAVMTDFLPELEEMLGPQPDVPELRPLEARNRFHVMFSRFLQPLCGRDHPLVLFLDDLQWADAATLSLIEALLSDADLEHVLIVGAYRENEVQAGHPLVLLMEGLKKKRLGVHPLVLTPLGLNNAADLIADSLAMAKDASLTLADFCMKATQGNPFDLIQLLKTMFQEGVLSFEKRKERWEWRPGKAQKLQISGNVLERLALRIGWLSPASRKTLALASCLDFQFDLSFLAALRQQSLVQTFTDLLEAVRAGLIMPMSDPESSDPRDLDSPLVVFEFRFIHDTIRQAANERLTGLEQQEVHLDIGRKLCRIWRNQDRIGLLPELVDHYNQGRKLIVEPRERIELARLNLEAAGQVVEEMALDAAAGFLAVGREMLPEDSWDLEYDLTFALHREGAQMASLNGQWAQAQALIDLCLARVRTKTELVEIHVLAMFLGIIQGQGPSAVDQGLKALKLFDLDPSDQLSPEALAREQARVMARLGNLTRTTILEAPPNSDPRIDMLVSLLCGLGPAAAMHDQRLVRWFGLQCVDLVLEHGYVQSAAGAFGALGVTQMPWGDMDLALQLGFLGLELARKYRDWSGITVSCYLLGDFLLPWHCHFRETEPYFLEGFEAGLRGGEFLFALFCKISSMAHSFFQGLSLGLIEGKKNELEKFNLKIPLTLGTTTINIYTSVLDNLMGRTPDTRSFDSSTITEQDMVQTIRNSSDQYSLLNFLAIKVQILFMYGHARSALETLDLALKENFVGMFCLAELHFYRALILSDLLAREEADLDMDVRKNLDQDLTFLDQWAQRCPGNFQCRRQLAAAEKARSRGRILEAAGLYDQAILSAGENEFLPIEALANEMAGRFWLQLDKVKFARIYVTEAHRLWEEYGSTRKLSLFEQEFLEHLPLAPDRTGISEPVEVRASGDDSWDRSALMKAAQAISGAMDLESLFKLLVDIVTRNAWATRCLFVLKDQDQWIVRAEKTVEDQGESTCIGQPVERCPHVPQAILRYVLGTRKPLVLADAAQDNPLFKDPARLGSQARSVLCLPVVSQREMSGLLYLENHLIPGIFTPDRLEVIELLAAQATVCMANVRLYEDLQVQKKNLQEANAALKVLLGSRDQDRDELEKSLLATLNAIVFPFTEKLKHSGLSPEQKSLVEILDSNLRQFKSSYARHLAAPEFGLTPMELQVAALIKEGHRTEEIADLLHVSSGTISFHRNNIRKKLGLSGKKTNLVAHLKSLTDR